MRVLLSAKKPLATRKSCDLWTQLCPFIVIKRPTSDLCWTCQKNNSVVGVECWIARNFEFSNAAAALDTLMDLVIILTGGQASRNQIESFPSHSTGENVLGSASSL